MIPPPPPPLTMKFMPATSPKGATSSIDAPWLSVSEQCLLLVLSFAPRSFSPGTRVFPSPQKPKFPNSNSTRNQEDEETLCACATSKSLLNYLLWHGWQWREYEEIRTVCNGIEYMTLLKLNGVLLTGALTKCCQRSEQMLKSMAAKIITKGKVCFWKQKDRECGKGKRNLLRLRWSKIASGEQHLTLSACCYSSNMCARNIWYTNPNKVNGVIATRIVDLLKGSFFDKLTRFSRF